MEEIVSVYHPSFINLNGKIQRYETGKCPGNIVIPGRPSGSNGMKRAYRVQGNATAAGVKLETQHRERRRKIFPSQSAQYLRSRRSQFTYTRP
jgi:hypothetical protein